MSGGSGRPVKEEVIRAEVGWLDFPWRELWSYRDLFWVLVRRDFVARYKQSILGPLWFVVQPLALTLLFTVVFGHFGKLSTDGAPKPAFYMGGLVLWNYFLTLFTGTSNVLAGNSHLFSKVYFPRLVLPLAGALSQTLQLLLNFALFLVFYAASGAYHWGDAVRGLLLFPFLAAYVAAFSLGAGLVASACSARYRDFSYLSTFATQGLMFATPVLFPLSSVPEAWRPLVALNPLAFAVEAFKASWFGLPMPSAWVGAVGVAGMALVFLGGLLVFNRVEKNFVDTI
ncbi:MAG TPA: ABC transporter permease [Candidatus Methylacidiphilales bacterium]